MSNEPFELPYDKCLELLSGGVLGRVAVCTPAGPRIIPVNYVVEDDSVVFRTTPYSVLGTYGHNSALAIEIDQLDYEYHHGWSVVATGHGSMIEDPDELAAIRGAMAPQPWAGGVRPMHVRLRWQELTGRRIGSGWTHDNELPVRRAL